MARVQVVDKAPDGGWAWVIVASTFFIHAVMLAASMSFGVFYAEFREVFQEGAGTTSFISSILVATLLICSPFAGALSNLTSCRAVIITGSVISAVGLIVSFFAQTMIHLFFSVGIFAGFGLSLMYSPSLAMIGRYFDKRHATANGIAICGTGVGQFALPPLFQFLIDEFGWRGALLIVAGLMLNGCVCGALMRPIHLKEDRREERTDRETRNCYSDQKQTKGVVLVRQIMETFDVTLLKCRNFLLYNASLSLTIVGMSIIYVHLVAHAQDLGVEKTQASFLLSIMGASDAVSRPINGWLSDRGKISKIYYYTIGIAALTIPTIAIPFATTYVSLVVCMAFYGLFSGVFQPLIAVVVREYSGVSRMSGGLGWTNSGQGVAFLLGPPIAGWLYDATGNYDMSFYVAAIFNFLSVIVILVIPCSTASTRKTLGFDSGELPDQTVDKAVVLKEVKWVGEENHAA